jgi:hypothetical protein
MQSLEHGIKDSIVLLPFLFVTYLIMEYVEHKTTGKTNQLLQKAGHVGPLIGGIAGIIPQCGISAAASNLYAGRLITMGTLLAVFLSTSDEMLPIMVSNAVEPALIGKILAVKTITGIAAGFLVDGFIRLIEKKPKEELKIHDICEHEHCRCNDGILKSALRHTLHIFAYILLITIVLNLGIAWIGEDNLAQFIMNRPLLGPVLSGIIGLIPNCAASVVITQMFLDGLMGFGTMMAGLLVGAGVGLMVLLRVNENKKESFRIILLLYAIGVIVGAGINLIG